MAKRGPHEWTPKRIQKTLAKLEASTVDTSKGWIEPTRVIGGAEVLPDNTLVSWHVTDDPEGILRALESRADLQETRPTGDLCGGLYVSSFPQIWRSRSRKKWQFAELLSPAAARKLARAVLFELDRDFEGGRLTAEEHERGRHDVEHYWLELGNWKILLNLSSLPYAINIQELAKKEGVAEPFEPALVEVIFEGRYLHATHDVRQDSMTIAGEFLKVEEDLVDRDQVCRVWRELGWDGAFTKAGMGTNPELVIWNMERILKFGPWTKGT
jgi:hypothetical protein